MIRNTTATRLGLVTAPDEFIDQAIAADQTNSDAAAVQSSGAAAPIDWEKLLMIAAAAVLAALIIYELTANAPKGRRRRR